MTSASTTTVRDFFDSEAARFDRRYETDNAFREREAAWDRMIAQYEPQLREYPLAIDVGCGSGRLSQLVAKRGYHCIGIDESPRMIELARRSGEQADLGNVLEFRQGVLPTRLEAPDGQAGLVLCSSVMEYVADPGFAARKLERLLAPGGVLLVSVPNRHARYQRAQRMVQGIPLLRRPHLRWQRWVPDRDQAVLTFERQGLRCLGLEYFASPRLPALFGRSGTPSGSALILLAFGRA